MRKKHSFTILCNLTSEQHLILWLFSLQTLSRLAHTVYSLGLISDCSFWASFMGSTSSPVLYIFLCQSEFSSSSFSLIPFIVSTIICGLYLQPRSHPEFQKTIFNCLLYIFHWTPTGTSTTWHKLNSPFWNHLVLPNAPSLCLYLQSIPVSNKKTECYPEQSYLSYTPLPVSQFSILNICQIHSLLSLSTATTHIQAAIIPSQDYHKGL